MNPAIFRFFFYFSA
ncbi:MULTISPECIES: pheST operon leader peptide PheM [Enterobacterales]|nr:MULTISPECIES: pheST operon leader peptide PheM [Enterobacterales]MDH2897861.1 pheST operon leader peptide PheM [Rahnella variigena]